MPGRSHFTSRIKLAGWIADTDFTDSPNGACRTVVHEEPGFFTAQSILGMRIVRDGPLTIRACAKPRLVLRFGLLRSSG